MKCIKRMQTKQKVRQMLIGIERETGEKFKRSFLSSPNLPSLQCFGFGITSRLQHNPPPLLCRPLKTVSSSSPWPPLTNHCPQCPKRHHVPRFSKALFIPYQNISPLTHISHILAFLIMVSPHRFQPQRVTTGLPLQTRNFPPPNSRPALGMLPGEAPAETCLVLRSWGGGRRGRNEDTH